MNRLKFFVSRFDLILQLIRQLLILEWFLVWRHWFRSGMILVLMGWLFVLLLIVHNFLILILLLPPGTISGVVQHHFLAGGVYRWLLVHIDFFRLRIGLPSMFRRDPARKLSANLYDIYHCCVYSEKNPDDGQRNCPKHVEFYSKNKFEKLVHLVGFIIRIYHDARLVERQKAWIL